MTSGVVSRPPRCARSEVIHVGFAPTDEQIEALRLFHAGDSMVIEAGAGTGKTSTLRLLAWSTQRPGRYLAFNKAIADDVQGSMPSRVGASTAHSLAFRAVGRPYARRLSAPRMKARELAQRLDLAPMWVNAGGTRKALTDGYLGGLVMRSIERFCQSAALEPGPEHVPYIDGIDFPEKDGTRGWTNNTAVRDRLVPAMRKAWADICDVGGQLRFVHAHYLKIFQLSEPFVPAEFIMLDEAQDLNPVLDAIVAAQEHAQLIYVGDPSQAIYEWTGAVNAMETFEADHRTTLTQSFRFGPAIAARANEILARIDSNLRLSGLSSIASSVGVLDRPAAILCRTNAHAVLQMLRWQARDLRPHLVGGGSEVLSFARAAGDLMEHRFVSHPELACFDTWEEVQAYVEQDAQGVDLKLLVELVDEYGIEKIEQALGAMPTETDADVVISTAHKAKGREWPSVQIADDFTMVEETPAELRLRYVAVTRAKLALDDTALREAERMAALKALRGNRDDDRRDLYGG